MFRTLLSLEKTREILKRSLSPQPAGVEQTILSEALGRVLAENVVAPLDVPPFARSTVDGYAVRAVDTFGAEESSPAELEFCGCIVVGETPSVTVKSHTTAEIVTGAPLPEGADAVVMLEYAIRRDNTVLIHRPVSQGENVMEAGSDIQKGETILGRGQTICSREIGVLAASGITQVAVHNRPVVAVISTGAEIVNPGESLSHGKIHDINAFTLSAAGPKDLLPQVLNALGKPGVIVSGIAVKPGKPTTIAVVDGKPVFSLPGHPTSALLMFYQLVRPQIYHMTGTQERATRMVKAVAEKRLFSARGRRTFTMVRLSRDHSGRLRARPVASPHWQRLTVLLK